MDTLQATSARKQRIGKANAMTLVKIFTQVQAAVQPTK